MASVLNSGGLRLRFVVALITAIVVAVVILTLPSGGTGERHAPSPGQVRAASAWLHRLRLPVAAIRDVNDTACSIPVDLCVTSRESARELAVLLRATFASQGGTPGTADCGSGPQTMCLFFAHHGGARIAIVARTLHSYLDRASVAFAAIQHTNPAPPATQPLPAVRSLGAIAGGNGVRLRCVQTLPSGCQDYGARFTSHGSAAHLARRWSTTLRAAGWLSFPFPCVAVAGGQRCGVSATRSIQTNGGRFIAVNAGLTDRPHRTVRIIVRIVALP